MSDSAYWLQLGMHDGLLTTSRLVHYRPGSMSVWQLSPASAFGGALSRSFVEVRLHLVDRLGSGMILVLVHFHLGLRLIRVFVRREIEECDDRGIYLPRN